MKSASIPDEELLKAVAEGDLKTLQERITAGADVNGAPKGEPPPLFRAISAGKLEIVQALLAARADVNRIAYATRHNIGRILLYQYERLARKLNRRPTKLDIDRHYLVNSDIYATLFGSWKLFELWIDGKASV